MRFFLFITLIIGLGSLTTEAKTNPLFGHWKGVKMFQDENSYDGKTYFLPNEGEMILDQNTIRLYYYPFFKSAEFNVEYKEETILYALGDKKITCNYHFQQDTLVFKMAYINKVFVKLFTRAELEPVIIADLDKYGFRVDKLNFEFELDTFHKDQYKGFYTLDSLLFIPPQFIGFDKEGFITFNRKARLSFTRSFKTINYSKDGQMQQLGIAHLDGTQAIHLIPKSQCNCDSIIIPYIAVTWANRIRKAIKDEEDF